MSRFFLAITAGQPNRAWRQFHCKPYVTPVLRLKTPEPARLFQSAEQPRRLVPSDGEVKELWDGPNDGLKVAGAETTKPRASYVCPGVSRTVHSTRRPDTNSPGPNFWKRRPLMESYTERSFVTWRVTITLLRLQHLTRILSE